MKIAVYAIAKNEEQFVERFYESCKDADLVLIADTGSTDKTVEKARELGIEVHQIDISPWRFDAARNAALSLVPDDVDVCVALDLDEVLAPAWREKVESAWKPETGRLLYVWDNSPASLTFTTKIHARRGYQWRYACHEVVLPVSGEETVARYEGVLVKHMPDQTKSRAHYAELLRLSAEEFPADLQACVMYARDLSSVRLWEKAFAEITRGLEASDGTSASLFHYPTLRGYAMRLAGKCCVGMGKNEEAHEWYTKAAHETPRREAWVDLAKIRFNLEKWDEAYDAAMKATFITDGQYNWPYDPTAWGSIAYELAAVSCLNLGRNRAAAHAAKLALAREPENERLQNLARISEEFAAEDGAA